MRKALPGIAALLAATSASASIISPLFSITPDGSNFPYTYNVFITADTSVAAGDKFTIFDFAGFVQSAASGQPADFDFSFQFTGPDHYMQNTPSDAANLFNLTWTYDGTTVVNDNGDAPGLLGTFSAVGVDVQRSGEGLLVRPMDQRRRRG